MNKKCSNSSMIHDEEIDAINIDESQESEMEIRATIFRDLIAQKEAEDPEFSGLLSTDDQERLNRDINIGMAPSGYAINSGQDLSAQFSLSASLVQAKMGKAAIFQRVVATMVGSAPTGSLFCFASETLTSLGKKRLNVRIYQTLMEVPRATVRLAVLDASNQAGEGGNASGLLDYE